MSNDFKWRHYRGGVILWAVRWYCRYGISYSELEEMLEERGVDVDHTTLYRWVQHYAPEMDKRLCWYWRRPSWNRSWQDSCVQLKTPSHVTLKFATLACLIDWPSVLKAYG